MKYATPRIIKREDEELLRRSLLTLMHNRLSRVRYRYPGTTPPESPPFIQNHERADRAPADEAGTAVVADFGDGTSLVVSWAMEGFAGGLAVETGSADKVALLPDSEVEFDASRSTVWRSAVGLPVRSVSAAWHVSGAASLDPVEYPETLWSIRLSFTDDIQVVMALGTTNGSSIEYYPQSIVLFSDLAEARKYTVNSQSNSILGEAIVS